MKKLLTISLTTLFLFFATAFQNEASAQVEEGDFKLGAGLAFGTGVGFWGNDNDLGLRADGYYAFTDVIRGGGDFTFYFPKDDNGATFTVWELNINGHYLFVNDGELTLYGLGGINVTGLNFSYDDTWGSASGSDEEFGINLGGGLEYALDFADFFAEAKLGGLGGNANQFVIGAGLRFAL